MAIFPAIHGHFAGQNAPSSLDPTSSHLVSAWSVPPGTARACGSRPRRSSPCIRPSSSSFANRLRCFRRSWDKLGPSAWWLIPLSKWVITPVINGISRVNPLITGVITHLLSGMSHQVGPSRGRALVKTTINSMVDVEIGADTAILLAKPAYI